MRSLRLVLGDSRLGRRHASTSVAIRPSRRLLATTLLALVGVCPDLCAQARVFAGTVRTVDGAPLVGAEVVATSRQNAIMPSGDLRFVTKTDADGRFAIELEPGRAFCTWATGVAGEDGSSWVVRPSYEAVAGRTVDWIAQAKAHPEEIRIRGLDGFADDGPLELGIMVSRDGIATRIPIDGDGILKLPPVPSVRLGLLLLGKNGQELAEQHINLATHREVVFRRTVDIQFYVADAAGKPIEGVHVMERRQHAHALTAPLQSWTPSSNLDRSLAITDKDGRAVGRTSEPGPNEIRQFYGQKPGLAGPYSGYLGQSSFEGLHHKGGTVSRPLKLELAPVEQQTLRLEGAPSELQLHAYLRGQWHCSDGDDFRMAEAATMSRPQLVSEGIATASVFSTTAPTWRAIGRSGSTPGAPGVPLVVAITATTTSAATTVAWQDLNTVNIRVVDPAGEPVAFATIGGALQGMQMPIDWRCTVVANANGEASLKLGGVAGEKWTVYAASSDQHGLAQFSLTKSADVEIVVQPFIDVALQVTDWNGHAVRGAVLQLQLSDLPASELGQCAIDASSTLLLGSHTDKGGRVSCKVPAELLGQVVVRAAFLENTSSPVTLEGGMLNLRLNKPGSTKK